MSDIYRTLLHNTITHTLLQKCSLGTKTQLSWSVPTILVCFTALRPHINWIYCLYVKLKFVLNSNTLIASVFSRLGGSSKYNGCTFNGGLDIMISTGPTLLELKHFRLHFRNTPFLYKIISRITSEIMNKAPRIIMM